MKRAGRKPRCLRIIGILAGAMLFAWGGFWLSQQVWPAVEEWTRLRDVVISGLDHVDREAILSRLALPERVSVLALDVDELTARVEAHPWVARATVDRVFPATLAVHVQERRGAAVLHTRTDRWVIDESGVLLEKTAEPDSAMPVLVGIEPREIEGDAARARVRTGIHVAQLVSDAFSGSPRIDLSHPDVIVAELPGLRFTFGVAVDEQWERFRLLYPSIRSRLAGKSQEVDLRYAQKIILRPRG